MAVNQHKLKELKVFLRSVANEYERYGESLYNGTFTTKEELGAADRADLEALDVPKGAAGLIIKAAQRTGTSEIAALQKEVRDGFAAQGLLIQRVLISHSSQTNAADLGRIIHEQPAFKQQLLTELPYTATGLQLSTAIQALGGSREGSAWLFEYAEKEISARAAQAQQHASSNKRRRSAWHTASDAGVTTAASTSAPSPSATGDTGSYANSAKPFRYQEPLSGEDVVQLAVGWILRQWETAGLLQLHWRDTSRSGVESRSMLPDFSGMVWSDIRALTALGCILEAKDDDSETHRLELTGQIAQRASVIFERQPSRQVAWALGVTSQTVDVYKCTRVVLQSSHWVQQPQLGPRVLVQHKGQKPLTVQGDSDGFHALLSVLLATAEQLGFVRDNVFSWQPTSGFLSEIKPLKLAASGDSPLSPRGTRVYQVQWQPTAAADRTVTAVLKVAAAVHIDQEVANLQLLEKKGLSNGRFVKLLDSGALSRGNAYLLVQPVGEGLDRNDEYSEHWQVLAEVGEQIGALAQQGLFYRDWSPANFGVDKNGSLLIWDLATLGSGPPAQPGQLTGTVDFMAVTAQLGKAATLSSELESVLYIACLLGSKDGVVHWRRCQPDNIDPKWTAMTNVDAFENKVLKRTKDSHKLFIQKLHDLFFPCQGSSYGYRINVDHKEFHTVMQQCKPLDAAEAALSAR